MNILEVRKFIRLRAFDLTTEQGRSDERYRLAILSMIANIISRVAAVVVMILAVSLTIPYLGKERFGVWMTIASFAGMLSFLDLGIGNALTNKVAHAATLTNSEALIKLISGGLGFLIIIGCGVGLTLAALSVVVPWELFIKLQDTSLYTEIQQSVLIFSLLFGLQIISNGVQRVFYGLQRAFEVHIINTVGLCLSLISLVYAVRHQAGVSELLVSTFGVQILANLLLIIILKKRNLISAISIAKNIKQEYPDLIKVGGLFFVLQIGVMLSTGIDSLIISSNLGVAQVAAFSLVQRLFQFATQPMNIMNAPLWGAYSDADSRGDKSFIRKTLIISLKNTTIFAIISSVFLITFGSQIIGVWTKNEIIIPSSLLVAYGLWSIFEMIGNALAIFLNGCGIVRQQVISVVILSIISIGVKVYAIKYHGLEGMIIGFVTTYAMITIVMYGYYFRESLEEKISN